MDTKTPAGKELSEAAKGVGVEEDPAPVAGVAPGAPHAQLGEAAMCTHLENLSHVFLVGST